MAVETSNPIKAAPLLATFGCPSINIPFKDHKTINITSFYLIISDKMRKEIKKIGSSIGIIFNKEEQKVYRLKLWDTIELFPKKIKEKP
jgi:hypothetical protein